MPAKSGPKPFTHPAASMTSETPQFQAHCERLIGLLPELANNVIRHTLDALRAPKGDLAVAQDR